MINETNLGMCEKKVIFLVDQLFYDDNHIGVRKKVQNQIRLFQNNGMEAKILSFVWKEGKPVFDIPSDTNILYFRNVGFSIKFAQKLFEIRKKIPSIRIIMEIPTYPFKGEQKNLSIKEKINNCVSKIVWKYCIDQFVVIGMNRKKTRLYGIPVIHATNGINFDEENVALSNGLGNTINMICVSGCYFWHGYDRIIKGLSDYYQHSKNPQDINVYVVGEGDCLQEYKELAQKLQLIEKHIFFCGKLEGEALQRIYNKCSLAIEVLAGHRKGLSLSCSLKSREYAAKGLPMITSIDLDISHDDSKKYILKVPADDSAIDIDEIVSFWKRIYYEDEMAKVREEIRNTFSKYCSWDIVFNDVIKYMKE